MSVRDKMVGGLRAALFFLCGLFAVLSISASPRNDGEYVYSGSVIDSLTKEPLPFASVSVYGGTVGTLTDDNGKFVLRTKTEAKSLEFSFIGYKDKVVRVRPGGVMGRVRMSSDNMLEEVVVTKQRYRYSRKNNAAVDVVKMVLGRKDSLDVRNAESYETKCYRKQTLSVSQAEDFLNWRCVKGKNEELLRATMDTSELSGRQVIAIFSEEILNKLTYRHGDAKAGEETLLEDKKALLDIMPTDLVGNILDDAADEINLYDNSFRLLFTEFVSPLANYGTVYYHYFISDTTYSEPGDTTKYIKMNFNPANAENFGFVGEMLVAKDGTYGVKKVSMRLSKDARINFVEAILIEQVFDKTEQGYYVLRSSKLVMEGSPTAGKTKGKGVYSRGERYYTPYSINGADAPSEATVPVVAEEKAEADSADVAGMLEDVILVSIDSALSEYGDTLLRVELDSLRGMLRKDSVLANGSARGDSVVVDSALVMMIDSVAKASEDSVYWRLSERKLWAGIDSALRVNDDSALIMAREDALRRLRGEAVVNDIVIAEYVADSTDRWRMLMPLNAPSRNLKDIGKLHDELNKTGQIKAINYLVTTFANEHFPVGDVQDPWVWIGPLWGLVKSNHLEGIRLTLDVQTAPRLNKRWFLATMGAYGFKDKRWKVDLELEYSFVDKEKFRNEFPRRSIAITYINDCDTPGAEYSRKRKNKILTSVLSWQDPNEFVYFQRLKLWHMWEYENGLAYKVHLQRNVETAADELEYRYNGTGNKVENIKTTEYGAEISYRPVTYTQYGMRRMVMTYQIPHIGLKYRGASKGMWSDYTYNKTDFYYDQNVPVAPVGNIDIFVKAGKEWNKCPYPLLYAPSVNLSYMTQTEEFFLMRNMEFLYDQYVSLEVTHYMDGWLLSRIPLIKKLKWRELWSFRAMMSGLTDKNNPNKGTANDELFSLPPVSHTMSAVPYMEWSVGLYNVFKLIRVEYVRRINYLDNPNVRKWGFRFGLQANF